MCCCHAFTEILGVVAPGGQKDLAAASRQAAGLCLGRNLAAVQPERAAGQAVREAVPPIGRIGTMPSAASCCSL